VLASVVSAGYYLYVIFVMFRRPRRADAPVPAEVPRLTQFVIGASAVLLLVFGVFPSSMVRLARASTPAVAAAPAASALSATPDR
jgi:NADH:ubiquinone oxidoreductase subunit 2 (subunit N)